jgi:hypothetical protein
MLSFANSGLIDMTTFAAAQSLNLELPTGSLSIRVGESPWSFDKCMGVGARINPKRGFLFVSKLLGKHIPTRPQLMLEAHETLVEQLSAHIEPGAPTVFVAMAETATGLGHGVYEAALNRFGADNPWVFLTSTRYDMGDTQRIDFLEEHSHAASQWMYLPQGPNLAHFLAAKTLVLMDDEVSTGRTFLNLEQSIKAQMPNLEKVVWVTLTCLSKETARPCCHLLKGSFDFEAKPLDIAPPTSVGVKMSAQDVLSSQWGRLGLHGFMQMPQRFSTKLDLLASSFNLEKPVLVLGQGEFMHASFLVAQALEARGATCFAQSTTRSPVMVYGAIEAAQRVPDPLGDGVAHYLYNLKPDTYGAIVVLCEGEPDQRLMDFCAQQDGAVAISMKEWSSSVTN